MWQLIIVRGCLSLGDWTIKKKHTQKVTGNSDTYTLSVFAWFISWNSSTLL